MYCLGHCHYVCYACGYAACRCYNEPKSVSVASTIGVRDGEKNPDVLVFVVNHI
jgi:hypothetical protein